MSATAESVHEFARKELPPTIGFACPPDLINEIDQMGARFNLSRSEIIRQALRWSFSQVAEEDARAEEAARRRASKGNSSTTRPTKLRKARARHSVT